MIGSQGTCVLTGGVEDQASGIARDGNAHLNGLRRAGDVCASLTALLGTLGVCGWIFDRPILRSVWSSGDEMKFNTGLGLAVLGSSLLLAAPNHAGTRRWALSGAGFVLVLGLLTLFEYVLSTNFGIDELIVSDRIGTIYPGRMAWQTALVFVLLATGILFERYESRRGRRPAQWLAVAALIFPTQALMAYMLGQMTILGLGPEGPYMAAPTAIAFACAALAVLLHDPNRYWMSILTARTPASVVCRRLLIASLFLPMILGLLALHVARRVEKPLEYSVATLAWLTTLVFLALVGDTLVKLTSDISERRRTEEALRRERERLALALKAGQMGVYDVNLVDDTLWWSSETYPVFGVDPESFTPTRESFYALVHPDDRENLRRRVWESIDKRQMLVHEFRITRPDGTHRWVGNRAQTEYDATGRPVRHFGVAIEVTDRRLADEELRHQRERLTLALEGTQLATWDWNIVASTVTFNERWWQMRGYSPEKNSSHVDVFLRGIHPQDRAQMEAALADHLEGRSPYYSAEFRVKSKAGEWIWIADHGKVFERDPTGRPVRMLGTEIDITERKRAQEALRDANRQLSRHAVHLESVVQQRTAKLREMVSELQHVSYAIVHDMRAPLRAMSTFSEMLMDNASGGSPENQEYCRNILTGARRLDKLIVDGLSYTKTVLQELPLEPVDLSKLLRGIVETYPNLHADKADIVIEGHLPLVRGNESLLTQCFSNLLGNAVKFVARGTRPCIHISANTSDGFAHIGVQDNGIGIPKFAQPRLFGMFQKLDTEYEGTGIGLAIVRKVVERMGGKVGVDSEIGKGSCFWVELPVPPKEATA
jgi:PAS domain S-box-containing protein